MNALQKHIHQRRYTIRSYEVDAGGRLSIPSIFNLLQDAASSHAFSLGVAVSQLMAENHTWVLSRIRLELLDYPAWRDTIQIETWPSGMQGAFAFRDFEIRDRGRQVLGHAASAWIVMDVAKRRPVRPTLFAERLKAAERAPLMPERPQKISQAAGAYVEKRFRVRYSDLDINQHVNNVSYIEWLLESIPGLGDNRHALTELEVNFLGEAFQGDQVLARCVTSPSNAKAFAHGILRESDGQELIRARTLWQ